MKISMQPSAAKISAKIVSKAATRSQRPQITLRTIGRKGRSAYASGPTAFPTATEF